MKRFISLCLCVCVLMALCGTLTASAAPLSLLIPEKTNRTAIEGDFTYTADGALQLTASSDAGTTVAVDIDQTVNLNGMRYVHLAVESTVPFNIAMKVSNGQNDVYPQLAGPSWYEHFQQTAPAVGEGVKAGTYVMVLDLQHYMQYNSLGFGNDGYAYIRSVHIFAKGVGTVTVKQLSLSEAATFTFEGQPVTMPAPQEVITTAPHTTGTANSNATDGTTHATMPSFTPQVDYAAGHVSPTVIGILVAGAVLIGAAVTLTVMKKKKKGSQ